MPDDIVAMAPFDSMSTGFSDVGVPAGIAGIPVNMDESGCILRALGISSPC